MNLPTLTVCDDGWDGGRERFIEDAEADRLLDREARKPWNLI